MGSIDITPEVISESNPDRVARTAKQSRSWADGMLIDRRGDRPNANMTALGLHRVVQRHKVYRSTTHRGLEPVEDEADALDLEAAVAEARHDKAPSHVSIAATWGAPDDHIVDSQNILGDSVRLTLDLDTAEIEVPILEATSEDLAYYGAILVEDGAVVRFPAPDYPVWKMELGVNYIDGLLMTDKGTGFYLEHHRDRPHWHQPLTADSGGYYILARRAPGRPNRHQLTGFQIPFGQAVYTGRGTIHCDAALTGRNWLVGYADSNGFSTALLRNRDGAPVRLTGVAY